MSNPSVFHRLVEIRPRCQAALPPTGDDRFDVLLSRHLLWTLPDPQGALRRWVARLRPGGTLIFAEGRWREAGRSGVPYVDGAETLGTSPPTS